MVRTQNLAALGVAGILAACSGISPAVSSNAVATSTSSVPASKVGPDGTCKSKRYGLELLPCPISFPPSGGSVLVSASDPYGLVVGMYEGNCSKGVAELTPAGTNEWTVTAGTRTGMCKAQFSYYNPKGRRGVAGLPITNQ